MKIKKLILALVFFNLLLSSTTHAKTLEVVFKNSMWGAGIGASLGFASWFFTEEKRARVLWSGMLRGSALGALFGVGYGFLEKEGAFNQSRYQGEIRSYLVDWNQKKKKIIIDTSVSLDLFLDADQNKYKLGMIQISF